MPVLWLLTEIAAPVEVCFDLSRSIDVHLESMAASGERAVAGTTSGLIGENRRFVDEIVQGTFLRFRHEHRFEAHGLGTRMTDIVEFATPLEPLVGVPATVYLRRLMRVRNTAIRRRPRVAEAAVIVPAAPRSEVSRRLRTRLVAITGVLGGLTVVHDLDHLRQGRSLPPVLYGVAVAALVSIRARSQRDRELAKRIVSGGAPGLGKRK